jgi:FMN phosphatase YigB (HAD superfamily)
MGCPTEITDILFDLGKVLVPFDWNVALQRLLAFLPSHRSRLLREDRNAFQRLFHDPAIALEKGEIDFSQFHHVMSEILDVDIPLKQFHLVWCDIFRVNQKMVRLGRALSTQYGTWLVSNTSEAHYRWIIGKFPEILFYRGAALSYEMGVMKPDAQYYEKVILLFRLSASRCVFIDDMPDNVEGAVRAGMVGIVYRNTDQLIKELEHAGVVVNDRKE